MEAFCLIIFSRSPDLDEYMKAPNRQEFIQTIIPMVEDYFSEEGKFDSVMITAIDKNTHIFQWGN